MRPRIRGVGFALLCITGQAFAANTLSSSGFTNCEPNADVQVDNADIQFDRDSGTITFDVVGSSKRNQNVTASLVVTAYGSQVYSNSFDPCDPKSKVDQLCPVPEGKFSARGSQAVPPQFLSQIPSIAFSVPDIDADAILKLQAKDSSVVSGCIKSGITNGRTFDIPAVSYVAVGIAGAALALSGLSALGSAGTTGQHAPSVGLATVIGWFQSMATNGMHSVNYPPVYRSFSKNFAFSGGLIPWNQMQLAIDNFRGVTGGNLTEDNVQYLNNATLAFGDSPSNASSFAKRELPSYRDPSIILRRVTTSTNDTQPSNSTETGFTHFTHGIASYAEQLMIPQANTFMTVLLIFAIVIAAITVGILLFKVILEAWALFGSFPKRLTGFRKRYWRTLAKTITNMILVLYGIWTLYCIFQFTHGDSWAAKLLAGLTFAIFTAILACFTFKIWRLAQKLKKAEGDVSALFENKETWIKYSIFYDVYKRGYWWTFMPVIIYMFAKGCVLAAGDGHGLAQTAGQLVIESVMLILLLWSRPYATAAGNWINAIIQVVRVLSVGCILVFVEQLGIAQTTKTITGVILIAVQAGLTGVLAILIAVNGIIILCKENPHRRQRKAAGESSRNTGLSAQHPTNLTTEKLNREFDDLTPLDARNSLLIDPGDRKAQSSGLNFGSFSSKNPYAPIRDLGTRHPSRDSSDGLVISAAEMGQAGAHSRSASREHKEGDAIPLANRQPTLPDVGFSGNYDSRRVL